MMCMKCNNELTEKYARPKDLDDNKLWMECDTCDTWIEVIFGELN